MLGRGKLPGGVFGLLWSSKLIYSRTSCPALRPLFDILKSIEVSARITLPNAEYLLQTHNESWNEGDPIDAKQFIEKITLDDITFYQGV